MEVVVPRELCRAHKPPKGVCYGLGIIPQISGAILVEPILQQRPLLQCADGVLGDAQRMGSYDWALCAVRGAKDDPLLLRSSLSFTP